MGKKSSVFVIVGPTNAYSRVAGFGTWLHHFAVRWRGLYSCFFCALSLLPAVIPLGLVDVILLMVGFFVAFRVSNPTITRATISSLTVANTNSTPHITVHAAYGMEVEHTAQR
jgi:hypothetical protein